MSLRKEDLIIPTFILVALTFVWVTGNPSMESVAVEEVQQFKVDGEPEFGEVDVYSTKNIVCTSNVQLRRGVAVKPTVDADREILPMLKNDASEPGSCAVVTYVEKTKVELYSLEVVL